MEKVRYMISDAANIVNVESHVLRYWEDELELSIPRNEMGHRYYTKENIQEFQRIKELKEQGYQLKAIRMIVHNGPMDGLTAEPPAGQAGALAQEAAGQAADGQQQEGQTAVGQALTAQQQTAEPGSGTISPSDSPEGMNGGAVQVRNAQQSILENTDKMAQFTDLMTQIVGKAIAANNQELSQNISEEVGKQVIKEMNYLMREREEMEEERFRKLDAAIRGNFKKKEEEKRFWKKKKPSQP